MQDKTATGIDGAAIVNRTWGVYAADWDLQFLEQVLLDQLIRAFVHEQAHRSFLGMGADVDNGPDKAGIGHAGHRDQHLTVQKSCITGPG